MVPQREINMIVAKIRDEQYGVFRDDTDDSSQILKELPNLDVIALKIRTESCVAGKTIRELEFRKVFGVTLVAILRKNKLIEHPDANFRLEGQDIIYIMGRREQIASASDMILNVLSMS